MRILYVCLSFVPASGAPAELRYLAAILAQKGHDVSVYTTNFFSQKENLSEGTGVREIDGASVHYFHRMWSARMLTYAPEFVSTLRKTIRDFDLVHLYGFRSLQTTEAAQIAYRNRVPYVITSRGSLTYSQGNRLYKRLYDAVVGRRILRRAARCLPFSEFERRQYLALGVPAANLEILPLGINPASFAELPHEGEFRRRHGLEGRTIGLFLGRFHPIKGLDLLLPALAQSVRAAHDLCVCLAGADDGSLAATETHVRSLGLEDHVRFVGFLKDRDKLEALVDCDFLVLPSRYDVFPNVLCEAWACRRPVVVTEGCGIADMVRDQELGYVARLDVDDLAAKLTAAATDAAWRSATGEHAREYVLSELDSWHIAERHERLYETLVGARQTAAAPSP